MASSGTSSRAKWKQFLRVLHVQRSVIKTSAVNTITVRSHLSFQMHHLIFIFWANLVCSPADVATRRDSLTTLWKDIWCCGWKTHHTVLSLKAENLCRGAVDGGSAQHDNRTSFSMWYEYVGITQGTTSSLTLAYIIINSSSVLLSQSDSLWCHAPHLRTLNDYTSYYSSADNALSPSPLHNIMM